MLLTRVDLNQKRREPEMPIELVAESPTKVKADWLVLPVVESTELTPTAHAVDAALNGALTRLRESGDLTGKPSQLVTLFDATGLGARRLLFAGLGASDALTPARAHRTLMAAVREVCTREDHTVAVVVEAIGSIARERMVEIAATALVVGSHSQQLYRGDPERYPLAAGRVVIGPDWGTDAVAMHVERGDVIGTAMNLTRELVNRHPGEVYPESFADRAAQVAAELDLDCEVFDEPRLQAERMQSLLAVARGSDRPPRMVAIEYRGGDAAEPPLALVGKGVTFDSGGLSLKPSDGMKSMKADMAGAATVLGAIQAIARLQLPVNVIGLMGLVENMPGSAAYKLGEVLTARNGVTIEVHNTDAEGRLVLADVLSYAVDRGAGRIVDLATLTGSCVVALGEEVSGAFTNDQSWCDAVLNAAAVAGEDVWQLPMFPSYAEQLKSGVADCKNVGTRWGGAITAAKFLEKFVGEVPWVHLDIAGPAFAESVKPHMGGGGTAAMLRSLVQLASEIE